MTNTYVMTAECSNAVLGDGRLDADARYVWLAMATGVLTGSRPHGIQFANVRVWAKRLDLDEERLEAAIATLSESGHIVWDPACEVVFVADMLELNYKSPTALSRAVKDQGELTSAVLQRAVRRKLEAHRCWGDYLKRAEQGLRNMPWPSWVEKSSFNESEAPTTEISGSSPGVTTRGGRALPWGRVVQRANELAATHKLARIRDLAKAPEGLLDLLRGDDPDGSAAEVIGVLERYAAVCVEDAKQREWWSASMFKPDRWGVVEAKAAGRVEPAPRTSALGPEVTL